MAVDSKDVLRHLLSTIAYRLARCVNNASPGFFTMKTANEIRNPEEIIRHMSQVLRAFTSKIENKSIEELPPLGYEDELKRFYNLLKRADLSLQHSELCDALVFKLVQGPLADLLGHIGQIAMLRRFYNEPVKGENFMNSNIRVGVVERENQDLSMTLFD